MHRSRLKRCNLNKIKRYKNIRADDVYKKEEEEEEWITLIEINKKTK